MLTVACVLRSGGIYTPEWVARLRDGVARNLGLRHRFVCLSDVQVPCERIALLQDWPGWWAKIELFRLAGHVLYFDLDTAITGDLRSIAEAATSSEFAVLEDFYRPKGIGSGVMGWATDKGWLYRRFADAPAFFMDAHRLNGDQEFIQRSYPADWNWRRFQSVLPGQIVSYKVHCREGIPDDARIVCLHGRPKFADMPANDPVRIAWEMAA